MSERELLGRTAEIAAEFLETLDERPIWPSASVEELRTALGGDLPEGPTDPLEVIEAFAAASEPGVVAIPSGRYFGFVIGGALPAALAADWLTSVWDQNAGLVVTGPAAAVAEEVAGHWLLELLGLPATASFAFVTGLPARPRDLPRGGAARGARACGLGRRGSWAHGIAADPGRRRRQASHHRRSRDAAPRAR